MLVAVVVVVLAAIGAAVVARSEKDVSAAAPRAGASSGPPQRVVLPGAPGDTAWVVDSDQVRGPDASTYNGVDTAFVQMMIVHHGQAVEMAKLAPGRAADAGVKGLAERIAIVQGPETEFLRTWLRQRNLPESDPAHDHGTMPGMQPAAAMTALAAARGADFDRRFVAMMTAHHGGALRMAGDVLRGGSDERLQEYANEMAVEQGSEMRRMAQLVAG